MNYKEGELYWALVGFSWEKEPKEVRYIVKAKDYGSFHWVTTTLIVDEQYMNYSAPRLVQSIVDQTLWKVNGQDLFLTRDEAERALSIEKRLDKLEHPEKKDD